MPGGPPRGALRRAAGPEGRGRRRHRQHHPEARTARSLPGRGDAGRPSRSRGGVGGGGPQPGRRDLRPWTIVTIDGEDAKDLDDAVSVARLPRPAGGWGCISRTWPLRPRGSALDREAYRRGTSVYLAGPGRADAAAPPVQRHLLAQPAGRPARRCRARWRSTGDGKVRRRDFRAVIRTTARTDLHRRQRISGGRNRG